MNFSLKILLLRLLGLNRVYVVTDIENGVMHNEPQVFATYDAANRHYKELKAFADDDYDINWHEVNINGA